MKKSNALAYVGFNQKNNRVKNDFYPTPPEATEILLNKFTFNGDIWECACGDGSMSKVLEQKGYDVYSSDLIDRGYGESGVDFLKTYKKFGEKVYKIRQNVIKNLSKLKNDGKKIIGYGAPAKATTALNFFGISNELSFIVEDNKLKHNSIIKI